MATRNRKTKIEKIGKNAEIMVCQMKSKGDSYREIADTVEKVFDEKISHQAVKSYFEKASSNRIKRMGQRNAQELEKRKQEELLEIKGTLQEINNDLMEAKNSIKEKEEVSPQDISLLISVVKEIRKQLKFQKDYIEEVTTGAPQEVNNIQINQNKTQMAIKFSEYLEDLEEKGVIEIKRPEKL